MLIENKDQEEIQEVIVSVADAEEIFEIKEEQRTTLEVFLGGKDVVALLLTHFGKSLVKNCTVA